MPQQFLNTPDDCQWLRETHLRALPQVHQFASFVMVGNEDAPDSVDLYTSADPEVTDSHTRARDWARELNKGK